MEPVMLARPTESHSNTPSTSANWFDPFQSVNRHQHNPDEASHPPTRDAAIRAYVSRGGYLQINQQSATEQYRRGDIVRGNGEPTQGENFRALARRERSCTAILRQKHVKRRLVPLAVSAIFLILVLSLYLAFAVSNSHLGQDLHILLIFMVLILGIVLCHALIRFSLAVLHIPNLATNLPSRAGPNGYAQLDQPIHVTLVGDEEFLAESNDTVQEKVTIPPPAYGLWRSSIRLNPDLLHWQRVNDASPMPKRLSAVEEHNKPASPRPPSYTSDNGVDYVVETQPRPFAHWPVREEMNRR